MNAPDYAVTPITDMNGFAQAREQLKLARELYWHIGQGEHGVLLNNIKAREQILEDYVKGERWYKD